MLIQLLGCFGFLVRVQPRCLQCSLAPVPATKSGNLACEVCKSVRDSSGVPRTLGVAAVVKGVAQAGAAVDDHVARGAQHLSQPMMAFIPPWRCAPALIFGDARGEPSIRSRHTPNKEHGRVAGIGR